MSSRAEEGEGWIQGKASAHLTPQPAEIWSISSTSTLTKVTEGYLPLSSSKKGAMRWQGPHQVAVKSMTTCVTRQRKDKREDCQRLLVKRMLHSGDGVLRSGQAEADRFFKKAYRLARVNELVELLLALDVDDASGRSLSHVVVVLVVVVLVVARAAAPNDSWPLPRPSPRFSFPRRRISSFYCVRGDTLLFLKEKTLPESKRDRSNRASRRQQRGSEAEGVEVASLARAAGRVPERVRVDRLAIV